ncbi:MAG TPA: hypothetical protein VG247_31175 [Pseudonocardiaceae bacterium]|nr:hypothetical protein [Pseudonocardiaceae bacterium]
MYEVILYEDAQDQAKALPDDALLSYFDALDVLELVPENGLLYNNEKPDGLRELLFGGSKQGKITYLWPRRWQEVHIVAVTWLDLSG